MQEADSAQPGTMAAVIGLEDAEVSQLCEQAAAATSQVVVAANFNAPGQVAVSGDVAAVDKLGELAASAGARKVVQLAVGAAFHSPLMEPAAIEMSELISEIEMRQPAVPVVTNFGTRPVTEVAQHRCAASSTWDWIGRSKWDLGSCSRVSCGGSTATWP